MKVIVEGDQTPGRPLAPPFQAHISTNTNTSTTHCVALGSEVASPKHGCSV